MNAQQFLAEFGHVAKAPGGIGHLRKLILNLAIRGALLPPRGYASDANHLLSEVAAYREGQVRNGSLRRPVPQPAIAESELAFSIPEGWAFARLGDVCEIVRGVTFPASKKQSSQAPGTVVCLRTSNVQAEIDWSDLIYIDSDFVGRQDQWVQVGDTMISMANSYELVGKVALVKNVPQRATFGGFIAAVRPHILEPDYLYLLLRSPYMQARMRATASQTTNIANISLGGMRPIPAPIPPKEEQSRIVAKVDELMALCDQLEKQQQERRKLQNALRQSTLQALASATSPNELQTAWIRLADTFGWLFHSPEDVSELQGLVRDLAIRGLLIERGYSAHESVVNVQGLELARENIRKHQRIRFSRPVGLPSNFEEPFFIPAGWRWLSLDQVCYQITDGAHHTPHYVASGIPFLSVKDVSSGVIDFSSTRFVTQDAHDDLCKRCRPERGDVLLTKVGTTGIAKVIDTDAPFSIFVSLALLKFPHDFVDPGYLELLISSPFVKKQSEDGTRGIGNKNLVLNTIKGFAIPLPPLHEQQRILVKARELLGYCDEIKAQILRANKLASHLAISAVSSLTGIAMEQDEDTSVKAPQTGSGNIKTDDCF